MFYTVVEMNCNRDTGTVCVLDDIADEVRALKVEVPGEELDDRRRAFFFSGSDDSHYTIVVITIPVSTGKPEKCRLQIRYQLYAPTAYPPWVAASRICHVRLFRGKGAIETAWNSKDRVLRGTTI